VLDQTKNAAPYNVDYHSTHEKVLGILPKSLKEYIHKFSYIGKELEKIVTLFTLTKN
jgi:hypothetical protein